MWLEDPLVSSCFQDFLFVSEIANVTVYVRVFLYSCGFGEESSLPLGLECPFPSQIGEVLSYDLHRQIFCPSVSSPSGPEVIPILFPFVASLIFRFLHPWSIRWLSLFSSASFLSVSLSLVSLTLSSASLTLAVRASTCNVDCISVRAFGIWA